MIEKTLTVPKLKQYVLRITPDFLHSEQTLHFCPIQLMESGNTFTIGESSSLVKSLDSHCDRLFGLGDQMYYRTDAGALVTLPATSGISGMGTVNCVFGYYDAAGTLKEFCATDTAVLSFSGRTKEIVTEDFGGKVGTYHNERLFLASGTTIYYTNARDTGSFAATDSDGGSFSVGGANGEIIALISYARRLYVFCTDGIFRVRADASDLNFKIEPLPYPGESILEGSVQLCGNVIIFLTAGGTYSFNGATAKKICNADESIVFPEPVQSCAFQGKYYAIANVKETEGYLFRLDPADGRYYFMSANASLIAACRDKLYYRYGNRLVRLEGRGFPAYSYEAGIFAEVELPAHYGKDLVIDSATLWGKGEFYLEPAQDTSISLALAPGIRTRLPYAIRARTFSFGLYASDEDCAVRSLDLHLREVGA